MSAVITKELTPIFVITGLGVYFKLTEACPLPKDCQSFETEHEMLTAKALVCDYTVEELEFGTYHINVADKTWMDARLHGGCEIEEETISEFLRTFEV